jgi:hypothetical protein
MIYTSHSNHPIIGWCRDKIEIRAGLEYIETMQCVVRYIDGPIAEKDIDQINDKSLSANFATKIMMIHLVSIDG